MKSRPTPSLRTQFAIAMIVAILIAIIFGYITLRLFVSEQQRNATVGLNPVAGKTLNILDRGGEASSRDVILLYRETIASNQRIDHQQDLMLIPLAGLACVVGVGVGLAFSRRFTRPIEDVGIAARQIASGDLSVRVKPTRPGAGELSILLHDFNSMADALEKAHQRSREDSAAIAHELRTPLTILRGRLQGYADGVFLPEPEDLRGLIEQVDLLTRIVEDLHVLSMAQSNRMELQRAPLRLDAHISQLLNMVDPVLREKGFTVKHSLASVMALADKQRIAQVFLVLVDNAVRHAAEGRLLEVATRREDNQAILTISDNGPGLDDVQISHMFEPFWRGEGSRNRAMGGSGLGLAVIKAILDAHAGSISVTRRAEGGLHFAIRLPASNGV